MKNLRWSLFLIDLQAWWCPTLSRKKLWQRCFPVRLLFKKTYFVEHVRTDAWVIWTKKKIAFTIYLQENTSGGVVFSAVADMWTYSFPKWTLSQMFFYENYEISQNINFREQSCATASAFLWNFRCITCFISDKSVKSQHGDIILVSYYHVSISINSSIILVLLY